MSRRRTDWHDAKSVGRLSRCVVCGVVHVTRALVGPFAPDVALSALAAGQTDKGFRYFGGIQQPTQFVALHEGLSSEFRGKSQLLLPGLLVWK